MKINKKGFTLVELLVVIAIIGILSTVAVVNLNSARDKAKVAAIKGTLASLIPSIVLCHNESTDIESNTADAACTVGTVTVWVEGEEMCDTAGVTANWPDLGTNGAPTDCESAYLSGEFEISATATDESSTLVTCNQNGCS
ncbi:MAG: prepilin-type N-terminal cleavage/methylation domain-containing protein [Candidatus Komeilibacteria bacterium]|jgi:prepilin-type N-terminal cleavage/methylation domain-containing protein|nr:prepilin-type N-terminal cleavage/methylation domain-containing protein [Candidatus Komeilibacteria bacterium]